MKVKTVLGDSRGCGCDEGLNPVAWRGPVRYGSIMQTIINILLATWALELLVVGAVWYLHKRSAP